MWLVLQVLSQLGEEGGLVGGGLEDWCPHSLKEGGLGGKGKTGEENWGRDVSPARPVSPGPRIQLCN